VAVWLGETLSGSDGDLTQHLRADFRFAPDHRVAKHADGILEQNIASYRHGFSMAAPKCGPL